MNDSKTNSQFLERIAKVGESPEPWSAPSSQRGRMEAWASGMVVSAD